MKIFVKKRKVLKVGLCRRKETAVKIHTELKEII